MSRPTPTLLRRTAAPAPVAITADDLPLLPRSSASPSSPRFPPGFPLPLFARSGLVASLFPQLAEISPDLRIRVAAQPSVACAAAPDVDVPSPKVRFAVNAARLEGSPPPPIQGAHRPCLKSASASAFKSSGRRVPRDAPSSPAPAVVSRPRSPAVDFEEDGWRLVRPPYWWREGRSSHQQSSRRSTPTFSNPRKRGFVKHKDRSCHRCLLKGHCKADCRNPFTCLRCRQIGHRARGCTNSPASSSTHRAAPPFIGEARPRAGQELAPRRRDVSGRHRRDDDRNRMGRAGGRRDRLDDARGDSRRDDRRDLSQRSGVGRSSTVIDEANERSPPPSPRTTFEDIIEIHPMSPTPGWLRMAAPCFGANDCPSNSLATAPRPPPPPASSRQLQEDHSEPATPALPSSTAEIIARPSSSPDEIIVTPSPTPSDVIATPGSAVVITSPSSPPDSLRISVPASPASAGCITPLQPLLLLEPEAQEQHEPDDQATATPSHAASHVWQLQDQEITPIFVPCLPALLPAPETRSTPPRPPKARRKTLAGVTGFQLPRHSPRLRAKNRNMPIAKLAEKLLCHRMGIVAEGEQITEEAIAKFAALFQGRLPDIAIAALRALFKLDCDLATAVEDALVQHGGEGGPDVGEATTADA